jgi:tRNA-Thr(GGU) m(6)t(6)A37 methyltransferase TsaA
LADSSAATAAESLLTLKPIGVVHSPFRERMEAPRQPSAGRGETGTLELFAHSAFEHALSDLASFRFIWVLFWFHQSEGFNAKVLPPRSDRKRGVFATRSPYRPNPIGLSAVELLSIEGRFLSVRNLDMLDQTPILDLKPYVPYSDCIPEATSGWLDSAADPIADYDVRFTARAEEQLAFLVARGVKLEDAVRRQLELGPTPHAYRRIKRQGDAFVIAYKAWRLDFSVDARQITVTRIRTGYLASALQRSDKPDLPLHREFVAAFGSH